MKSKTPAWILYNVAVCFAVYWLSNLILWFPWSVSETLGQILMLTINPVLWGFASYLCIARFPGNSIIKGVALNSLIFIAEAIVSDLIFFAGIRHAADKLLLPTTYYGWGFVATVPFIIYLMFRKRLEGNRQPLTASGFRKPVAIGLISFLLITAILVFRIQFGHAG